jgi:hypothetical protein
MSGNVTFREGSEGKRTIGEVNGGTAKAVDLPVGLLHRFDSTLDLGFGWLAVLSGGLLPKANSCFRGSVKRATCRFTPAIE